MSEKERLVKYLSKAGLDALFIIKESFLGYKYRKYNNKLYNSDVDIPTQLIRMYYGLNPDDIVFDKMKTSFMNRYIMNESKLEGINDSDIHGKEEIEGLRKMYEYIHSDDINYKFDIYTLKDLHKQLFSCAPFPENAGNFRNMDVYLPHTGSELTEWSMIRPRLDELDKELKAIQKMGKTVKKRNDVDKLLNYMDSCIELKCKLIKVHPFRDGNGRTIRGFTNKLFEDVGLPPIYIKANERTEYHRAMNLANNEANYSEIKQFYRYKVCDSIIELDINSKVNSETHKEGSKVKIKKPNE